jgi:hypothetical protein
LQRNIKKSVVSVVQTWRLLASQLSGRTVVLRVSQAMLRVGRQLQQHLLCCLCNCCHCRCRLLISSAYVIF